MSVLREAAHFDEPSVFSAAALLREARRQKQMPVNSVPPVCVLDPDGDLARALRASGKARMHAAWPCYHTELLTLGIDGHEIGLVPCVVGGPFAVLVAEELFASGCQLLVSVTSAGRIAESHGRPPYFFLIESAWRDDGTSHHYLSRADTVRLEPGLQRLFMEAFTTLGAKVEVGSTWTTDAPFRETESAITFFRERGVAAVEMEAASLYAFAEARKKSVVCFAYVTNQMAVRDGDFEKGHDNGARDMLELIRIVTSAWSNASGEKSGAPPEPEGNGR